MTDARVAALASLYVAPDGVTFWGWGDGGTFLVWARGEDGAGQGSAIAATAEVVQALARVAPQGLPSFQAVALLLGACREGWVVPAQASFARVREALPGAIEAPYAGRVPRVITFGHMVEALRLVEALPAALRTGAEAKAALIEVVLERAPRVVEPALGPAVVQALDEGVEPAQGGERLNLDALRADLHAVRDGLASFTPERLAAVLEARRRTGLDDVPRAAPVTVEGAGDEPPSARASRLIDALVGDDELGALARLARDLRAAVHVPRSVTPDDELPLGGVSDLTNRGPLDRLLTSELAHDDLTFVVRVATGEALYLRREAPPRGPEGGRAILVDAGVRLWGVCRVFATAVALAAAASAGRRTRVEAWSARGGALVPLELGTREGLLRHLEALDAAPHPGAALGPFLAAAGPGERLLITHEDALDDPELRRALGALGPGEPLLVATVARDGAYRLRSVGARGHKALSQARLDLSALLAEPTRSAPLASDGRLPAAIRRDPPPLRVPYAFDADRARAHAEHGVVALTRDGRLLHFPLPAGRSGGVQLTDQVPTRSLVWLDLDDAGVASALVGPHEGAFTLVRVGTDGGGFLRVSLSAGPGAPLCAVRHGAALLLIHARHVDVVALATGRRHPGLPLPAGVSWRCGRYFTCADGWLALCADGLRAALEPLPGFPKQALALWDREGHEGAWGLEPDGIVLSGTPIAATRVERLLEGSTYTGVVGISGDGHRLLVRVAGAPHPLELVDLRSASPRPRPLSAVAAHQRLRHEHLEPALRATLSGMPQVRTRLQGLAVDSSGALALVSRRRRIHRLLLAPEGFTLRALQPDEARLRAWRPFEDEDMPAGWSLRVARWPDGSRAFLDGRGLLHLVPSRGAEVTLALADPGPLAAWTTDGDLVGPAYYTGAPGGDAPDAEAARRVLGQVQAFCEAIR